MRSQFLKGKKRRKKELVYKPGSVYAMNFFYLPFSNQKQLSKAGLENHLYGSHSSGMLVTKHL